MLRSSLMSVMNACLAFATNPSGRSP
jgi:hypothetical protein